MFSSIFRSHRNRKKAFYVFTLVLVVYLICTETSLLAHDEALNHRDTASFVGNGNVNHAGKDPSILLVSALFPLEKSKHSHGEYDYWLSQFLGSITTPVYFYTTPSLASTVLSKRGSLPIHINTSFTSPFDIPPLRGLQSAYNHIHTLDREAFRHNPELYAVWNAKPWLLDNAVQQLRLGEGRVYDYAFWNDAGSFRDEHHYKRWPDPKRVEEVWQTGLSHALREVGNVKPRTEDMLFFPFAGTFGWLKRYWKEDDGPVDLDISEGSFFGGSPETVSWWSKVYYIYHDYYLNKGYFVGKDQTLINSLFLLFPNRIFGVWLTDPATRTGIGRFDMGAMGSCGNPWFYYQFFFASEDEREAMKEKWMRDVRNWAEWPWRDWEWWLERQECKLTRVVWMKDMLRDAFGQGWGVRKTVVT